MRHGLQSLRMKRHLMYRASFRAKRLRRFGDSNGVAISCANSKMVSGEVGTGKRAPESHFGCPDSLSEPSLRCSEPKDLRGTRAGRRQYSFLKRSRESLYSCEHENLGVHKTKSSVPATVLSCSLCIFNLSPPFGSFNFCDLFYFTFLSLLPSEFLIYF